MTTTTSLFMLTPQRSDHLKRAVIAEVCKTTAGPVYMAMAIMDSPAVNVEVLTWDWADTGDSLEKAPMGPFVYAVESGSDEPPRIETRLMVRLSINSVWWQGYASRGDWDTVRLTQDSPRFRY